MMPTHSYPLGVDIGTARLRVAYSAKGDDGRARLVAVATRDMTDDPVRLLRDAVRELGVRERRCVVGITAPHALVRVLALPPMSRFERARAASFQAARLIDYPVAEAALALRPLDGTHRWALGIARRSELARRIDLAKRAKLVPVAVDDVAFALQRACSAVDATIDLGDDRTRLTVFTRPIPFVMETPMGGHDLTEAIARSLGIDASTAEDRKRTVGFAGAGEAARDALIEAVGALLNSARAAGHGEIATIALVGNGGRIPGLAAAFERATGCAVHLASFGDGTSDHVPADVLRAAAPDWSVAYGLSLWAEAS